MHFRGFVNALLLRHLLLIVFIIVCGMFSYEIVRDTRDSFVIVQGGEMGFATIYFIKLWLICPAALLSIALFLMFAVLSSKLSGCCFPYSRVLLFLGCFALYVLVSMPLLIYFYPSVQDNMGYLCSGVFSTGVVIENIQNNFNYVIHYIVAELLYNFLSFLLLWRMAKAVLFIWKRSNPTAP